MTGFRKLQGVVLLGSALLLASCAPSDNQVRQRVEGNLVACPDGSGKLCEDDRDKPIHPLASDDDRPVTVMGGSILLTGGAWTKVPASGSTPALFNYDPVKAGFAVSRVRIIIPDDNDASKEVSVDMAPANNMTIELFRDENGEKSKFTFQTGTAGANLQLIPKNANILFKSVLRMPGKKIGRILFTNVTTSSDPDEATSHFCKLKGSSTTIVECKDPNGGKEIGLGFELSAP